MYENFARVYDTFMDNVPYEEWSRYLIGLLRREKIEDGLVLELGCGTGSMTQLLSAAGYDMIGVDNSEDMLEIAMEKKTGSGLNILYLLQDMRDKKELTPEIEEALTGIVERFTKRFLNGRG